MKFITEKQTEATSSVLFDRKAVADSVNVVVRRAKTIFYANTLPRLFRSTSTGCKASGSITDKLNGKGFSKAPILEKPSIQQQSLTKADGHYSLY